MTAISLEKGKKTVGDRGTRNAMYITYINNAMGGGETKCTKYEERGRPGGVENTGEEPGNPGRSLGGNFSECQPSKGHEEGKHAFLVTSVLFMREKLTLEKKNGMP